MSKGAYIGINNVAHKIKKGYIGVNGVARRIKKAYIGIGGVARPCWSGGELVYYGTVENLGVATPGLAATHVGDYALFGGGEKTSMVYAYGKDLVRIVPNDLASGRSGLAATHMKNYAIFGAGQVYTTKATEAYNIYLTKIEATEFSQLTGTGAGSYRTLLAATHAGGRAIFAGGNSNSTDNLDYVDIYDDSLTKTTNNLSLGRWDLAATHVGDYAIFAGGFSGNDLDNPNNPTSVIDAFDSSSTRISSISQLDVAVGKLSAARAGQYAIFCGGYYLSGYYTYNNASAYDANLVKIAAPSLGLARYHFAGTSVGDFAIFGGGNPKYNYGDGSKPPIDTVEVYDSSLTRTYGSSLSEGRIDLAATHIGNYALFGGGTNSYRKASSVVDVYTIV